MKKLPLLATAATLACLTASLHAATVYRINSGAGSGQYWNQAANWNDSGNPAASGKDYVVANGQNLRASGEFAGDSLTFTNGGSLGIFNAVTVDNLSMTGSGNNYIVHNALTISLSNKSGGTSSFDISSDSLTFNTGAVSNRTLTINQAISGTAKLISRVGYKFNSTKTDNTNKTVFASASNTWSGDIELQNGTFDFTHGISAQTLTLNGDASEIGGLSEGYSTARFFINDGESYTFTSITTGTHSLDLGTYSVDDLNSWLSGNGESDKALFEAVGGASGLIIVAVPEPSSAALLGLGGLALILRRRRK
ncbi:MAG: PEP-CTERM sorting domain-containing protein [Akkermansiaceae bacterium]|nr:PEP-CTERM sorting domain-containing protein [Akkermansiaceae bacterium]